MDKNKTIITMFNYGGGMRGLIPAHIMAQIEKKTELRMSEMVDVFAGPSTGSILNTALNIPHPDHPKRPKYRARHMVKFYEREGIKIFPDDRHREFRALVHDFNNRTLKLGQLDNLFKKGHYDQAYLQKALKTLYGETKLSETLKSIIIPVYNIDGDQDQLIEDKDEEQDTQIHTEKNFTNSGGHALWLKNIQFRRNQRAVPDVKLHDAVLASTAAPTYYPCHHFKVNHRGKYGEREYSGVDGSIFDNPCISYHGALHQHIPLGYNVKMIMLGTGHTLRSFKKDDWNNFGGLGVVDPVNDLPLINILFHASESALTESFTQELNKNDIYMFNKSLILNEENPNTPSTEIDDASPENLKKLRNFAQEIIEDNQTRFDDMCQMLVTNYELRQNSGGAFWNKARKIFKTNTE